MQTAPWLKYHNCFWSHPQVPTGEGDETKSLTVEEILKLIEDFARLH
jgi:2,4-dienoyl-CoA reductase-like NADH-dependent reductase (Old Yellow Enzyme family)